MNELFYFIWILSAWGLFLLLLAVSSENLSEKVFAVILLIWIAFGFWLNASNVQRNRDKNNQIVVYSEIKESEAGLYYKDALGKSVLIDKDSNFYFADRSKFIIKIKVRKGDWYNGIYFTQRVSYQKLVEKPNAEKEIL